MLLLNCSFFYAQEGNVIRPGLIKVMGTISPSKMFNYNESYFYFHGNLEGFINKRVSAVGESYYFLGEQTKTANSFKFNHNLFFGLSYHFTRGSNDFYLGLQPGVSIAKLNEDTLAVKKAQTGVNPVFSFVTGYNFYVGKYFNFFIQTRYIAGEHNYNMHKNLSEIRLSAGLGFNINALKEK